MFGWTAPLLHVHDFHVQHSPKLHLDPAKALHKRVGAGGFAAAPDQLSRITGGKSQHSSLSVNHSAVRQDVSSLAGQRAARTSLGRRNDHRLDRKLIDSPSEPVQTHTAEYRSRGRVFCFLGGFFPRCLRAHRLASGGRSVDEVGHLKIERKKEVCRAALCLPRCLQRRRRQHTCRVQRLAECERAGRAAPNAPA